ncbi:FAD-binding oxidoreductase [Phaeobacter sp. J2-8]|uniref:NAD(P)/FAD-dependent oxidoreductase n=1 Tax=Phaeobacter sp. J2-8 TaxID=2931394 RepID=UPI0032AF854B
MPQLKVISSAMRTDPIASDIRTDPAQSGQVSGLGPSISLGDLALRLRRDGGLTVASSSTAVAEIVPDSFRHVIAFQKGLRSMMRGLSFRLTRTSLREFQWLLAPKYLERSLTQHRIMDPDPSRRALNAVQRNLQRTLPHLADVEIAQRWGGYIDVTPDAIPVISTVAEHPGLTIGTGFSGHGFGIGPAAGRALAELASGRKPTLDLTPFRFERFSDGSEIELQSWL